MVLLLVDSGFRKCLSMPHLPRFHNRVEALSTLQTRNVRCPWTGDFCSSRYSHPPSWTCRVHRILIATGMLRPRTERMSLHATRQVRGEVGPRSPTILLTLHTRGSSLRHDKSRQPKAVAQRPRTI